MALTKEQINSIPKLLKEKKKRREIAAAFSCSRSAIDYWIAWLKRQGVKIEANGAGRPPTIAEGISNRQR